MEDGLNGVICKKQNSTKDVYKRILNQYINITNYLNENRKLVIGNYIEKIYIKAMKQLFRDI